MKSNDTLTHFPADVVLPLAREWIEIYHLQTLTRLRNVLPLAREWIEISSFGRWKMHFAVLPLAREWIEI